MARLRDLPKAIRKVGFVPFMKRIWVQINEDNVFTWASALAYAWLFAIFPFLIFVLTLFPYLPERLRHSAERQVRHAVHESLPAKPAEQIAGEVERVLNEPKQGVLSLGLFLALWGASGGMAMTMSALDRAYDVERGRPYFKQRATAIFLTISVATLILLVAIFIPIGTALTRLALRYADQYDWLRIVLNRPLLVMWEVTRYALGTLFLVTAVGLLYHFGPSIKQRWRLLTPGAAFAMAGWFLLGVVFRQYVDHSTSYDKTYGAVGGVVIMLLCFYLDALILLIGAEINSEVDYIVLGIKPGTNDFRGEPESTPVAPAP